MSDRLDPGHHCTCSVSNTHPTMRPGGQDCREEIVFFFFCNQAFSKRKRWVLGREVKTVTNRGMWSEGVPSREEREELGNL
jgi:hypothetical protein